MNNKKIPVILITGYLGSGKTTLMQNLLKQEQRKIALIVNDTLGIQNCFIRLQWQFPMKPGQFITDGKKTRRSGESIKD